MKNKVLPQHAQSRYKKTTLEEDEDQGEMDTVFFIGLFIFTVVQVCIDWWWPNKQDKIAIGKFDIIMSNLWAFFPIMQAQGLFLKSLLIGTCWYSILWHWTAAGFDLPGNHDIYGALDAMFSVNIIIAYAISWLPKIKTKKPTIEEEKQSCWYKNCRGPPKETSEWRCRWTPNLVLNVLICTILGIIHSYEWPWYIGSVDMTITSCWVSIAFAMFVALYQLFKGNMTVGKKYRVNFIFWAIIGILFGIISFIFKLKSNTESINSNIQHSLWHAYVMSCAYCMSRGQEYLEIYQ